MAAVWLDKFMNDTVRRTIGHGEPFERSTFMGAHESEPATRVGGASFAELEPSEISRINKANDLLDNLSAQLQSFEMDPLEKSFWVLFFSVMVLVATGGNIIVIYTVSTKREMKSVTNYFLVNLSLADTMVSTLNVIFNFISMLNSNWPFGEVYCKISNFIAILSISASVFTLTAISCDRYNAIIHPLRPRMSHRHALAWILLIWTLSALIALPNAIYSTLVEDRLLSDTFATTCTMIWPDGRYPTSSQDHVYNIVLLVSTYLVPIVTMAILYYKVGKELWGYEAIGENVDKQHRAIMAKKKIVKMMMVVVVIFALCWLPYHGFFVINYYLPTLFHDAPLVYQRCYLFMYWLAMSNSMYNPIIIYFMNSKFRHEFRRVLWLACCCRRYVPPPPPPPAVTRADQPPANQPNQSHSVAAADGHQRNRRHTNESSRDHSAAKGHQWLPRPSATDSSLRSLNGDDASNSRREPTDGLALAGPNGLKSDDDYGDTRPEAEPFIACDTVRRQDAHTNKLSNDINCDLRELMGRVKSVKVADVTAMTPPPRPDCDTSVRGDRCNQHIDSALSNQLDDETVWI